MPSSDTDGAIHTRFGLTYANYLVLDPAATEGLNSGWHYDMTRMLVELWGAFPGTPRAENYLALAGQEYEYGDLDDRQLAKLNIATNLAELHDECECGPEPDEDGEADSDAWHRYQAWEDRRWDHEHEDQRWYDERGDEHEGWERLTVPYETREEAEAVARIIVPRALLQSMPAAWQDEFVALLKQTDQSRAADSYRIIPLGPDGRELYFDPAPHYDRGRTYIEPQLRVRS